MTTDPRVRAEDDKEVVDQSHPCIRPPFTRRHWRDLTVYGWDPMKEAASRGSHFRSRGLLPPKTFRLAIYMRQKARLGHKHERHGLHPDSAETPRVDAASFPVVVALASIRHLPVYGATRFLISRRQQHEDWVMQLHARERMMVVGAESEAAFKVQSQHFYASNPRLRVRICTVPHARCL